MNKFVIAHLSDVHLPLPETGMAPHLFLNKRFFSYLSWKLNRRHHYLKSITDTISDDIIASHPDLVAISGDLTNMALPVEFQAAQQWLNTLNFPKTRVVLGNHDAMVKITPEQGKNKLWPWMNIEQNKLPFVTRRGPVALIEVNTAIPTPPFMATGKIGETQLQQLAFLLSLTKQEGLCRIVMLHHPPLKGMVAKRKSLLDSDEFCSIISQNGAELVLHGHSHQITQTFIPARIPVPVLGISSASRHSSAPDRAAAWNKIDIYRKDETWNIDVTVRQISKDHDMMNILHTHTFAIPC